MTDKTTPTYPRPLRRLTCGNCHRTWIGGSRDFCECGGTAWVLEWVYEWSWCLGCGASGNACLVQGPCEVCGGDMSALEPGEEAPQGFVETSATAMSVMPSKALERCSHCGQTVE